jgi:hypothetical protein
MRELSRVEAFKVVDEAGRQMAIDVLRATYEREKSWVTDAQLQVPSEDIGRSDVSWFVVCVRGRVAGTVRILYAPPLEMYAQYGLKMMDGVGDIETFIRQNRIAEVGRFAVVPRYRRQLTVAAALIRALADETLARGFTHYVTDVFEDDPHSPYGFHTRVMGFLPVATHETGELNCRSRRITLVLDLRSAYRRLRKQANWVYRYLTVDWDEALHRQLA